MKARKPRGLFTIEEGKNPWKKEDKKKKESSAKKDDVEEKSQKKDEMEYDMEEDKTLEYIKELIDSDFSGSNEEQGKAAQLFKGLAFSDNPAANKFMKEVDKFTSGLDAKDFEEAFGAFAVAKKAADARKKK